MLRRLAFPFAMAALGAGLLASLSTANIPDLQTTYRAFTIGSGPVEIVSRDVDADGLADILTAGWTSATLLRATEDGLYSGSLLPVIDQPRSLAVGDFDEDGWLDVALTNRGAARVSILLGSAGGFASGAVIFGFDEVYGMRTADLDGNGHLDLAVTNGGTGGRLFVVLGHGDGTFDAPVTYMTTGKAPQDLEIADLSDDAIPDIVVANSAAGTTAVAVFLGVGDGTFASTPQITGYPCFQVAVEDFDGDSVPDILATNEANNVLSLRHGNGDGTFAGAVTFAAGSTPQELVTADVTGDGRMDALYANYNSDQITLLAGNGDGTFQPAVLIQGLQGMDALALADVNGDGRLDLLTGGMSELAVLHGDGAGGFDTPSRITTGDRPMSVAFGLLNGDDYPDMVVSHTTAANSKRISVFLGNGSGGFGPGTTYTGPPAVEMACADVTGDGRVDVVCANGGGVRVEVLPGNGTGGLGAAIVLPSPGSPNSLALGDLNLDGRPDIVVGSQGAWVGVILAQPGGTFAPYVAYATNTGAVAVAVGDLNGDGFPDVAATNRSSSEISLFPGDGTGALGPKTDITGIDHTTDIEIHDFNGDGAADIAAVTGEVAAIYLGRGDGTFLPRVDYGLGGFPVSLRFADLNRDGTLDMITAGANWNAIVVRTGDGVGRFPWHYLFGVGTNPFSVAVADLDGDGRNDVAAANTYGTAVAVLRNVTEISTSGVAGGTPRKEGVAVRPNPARGPVAIEFSLAEAGKARLSVFDVRGRLVSREEAMLPAGPNRWTWDARAVSAAPGVYFFSLETAARKSSGRFVLSR